MSIQEKALEYFAKIHEGQFRRDGITPYITHPIAVAEIALGLLGKQGESPFSEKTREIIYIVSLGHDSLEDHPDKVTLEEIKKEFGFEVGTAIDNLTKRAGETYLESILRAKPYVYSRVVKISDNTHNLSTLDPKKDKHKMDKYLLSKYILEH